MFKPVLAVLFLTATTLSQAQPTVPASRPLAPRHYRLTFLLTDPQTHQPPQSLQLDIPITTETPGMAGLNIATGLTGQVEGSIQQSLECTDVHASTLGLAATISFSAETVLAPIAGTSEPIHRKFIFNKQIDVVMQRPTEITDTSRLVPIGAATQSQKMQPVTITVTATEI